MFVFTNTGPTAMFASLLLCWLWLLDASSCTMQDEAAILHVWCSWHGSGGGASAHHMPLPTVKRGAMGNGCCVLGSPARP